MWVGLWSPTFRDKISVSSQESNSQNRLLGLLNPYVVQQRQ